MKGSVTDKTWEASQSAASLLPVGQRQGNLCLFGTLSVIVAETQEMIMANHVRLLKLLPRSHTHRFSSTYWTERVTWPILMQMKDQQGGATHISDSGCGLSCKARQDLGTSSTCIYHNNLTHAGFDLSFPEARNHQREEKLASMTQCQMDQCLAVGAASLPRFLHNK